MCIGKDLNAIVWQAADRTQPGNTTLVGISRKAQTLSVFSSMHYTFSNKDCVMQEGGACRA